MFCVVHLFVLFTHLCGAPIVQMHNDAMTQNQVWVQNHTWHTLLHRCMYEAKCVGVWYNYAYTPKEALAGMCG